ncbi:MAG: hypothetical protein ABI288_02395 [Ginsengibacter sp.]
MANYITDRSFTDHIHHHIAIPKIYSPIKWKPVIIDTSEAKHIDMFKGIDYIFDDNHLQRTVQERFRERKYQQYSDFTIRYRRDSNIHSERHRSEYFKMKADFFTYGITNCYKEDLKQCTDFLKYAIIDLQVVYAKIDSGDILIKDNGQMTCRMVDKKIECPIKYNSDDSSSFFPIEIPFLVQLWGSDVIISQKGFL